MIKIREASPFDNNQLLRLTSLAPMTGKISLRIDRNPDFFSLLNKRGTSKVLVAEDNGNIVGCFSASRTNMVINGNPERVFYLADLKIDPSYERKVLTARLLKKMEDYLRDSGADILFCTAALGNEKVKALFSGRADFPEFNCTGTFRVYQIIPLLRKIKLREYAISRIDINDEITGFYNEFYKRYQYSPIFTSDVSFGTSTFAAMNNNNLVASLTLEDMGSSKQNVLMRLPSALKIILSLLGLINRIMPLFNLPVIGEPVRILYIKAFAYKEGREDAFDALIRHAGHIAFLERYHYLAVGIHERDSSAKLFSKYAHFTFNSLGFVVSLENNDEKISKILNGVLYEDYSLV
jgi:ribosomal protein S18 acetylase RimI-like enzyme